MSAQLEEDFSCLVVTNTTTFGKPFLAFNDVDSWAFSKCSKKISLLFDYLLISENKGNRSNLWWEVHTWSNRSQATCYFINLLELNFKFTEVFGSSLVLLIERSREWSDCDTLCFGGEIGQFLIELFTDERHHRMQSSKSILQANEES